MIKLVVLSCVFAAAASSLIGALGYAAPFGYPAPLAYPVPLLRPYNYRGPLSLAPGQPANIIAADGRPLDTWAVNADRTAHYTAKALEGAGVHLLKKRSTPVALNQIPVGSTSVVGRVPLTSSGSVDSTYAAAAPYDHKTVAN